VRCQVDKHQQKPKDGALEGVIRLFILNSDVEDKAKAELEIRRQMAIVSKDKKWNTPEEVRCLTLEHAMAAQRGGFSDFFIPLSQVEKLRDAALNGTSREVKFITDQILPLLTAIKDDDQFEIARIIKHYSTLLNRDNSDFLKDPFSIISAADRAVEELKKNMLKHTNISLREILRYVHTTNLLEIPEKLLPHLNKETTYEEQLENIVVEIDEFQAWHAALTASIDHAYRYSDYISEKLGFTTHQGVKGLEFNRVMAVLDDKESKGFLFNHEKLFGAEVLSKKDIENEANGKDSAPSRARRLFYVICSRAEKSLAVVAYSQAPEVVKKTAIDSKWFQENEVVLM